ncbi:MAG: Uncharacterised protein [SAR116 cluster bacterium]|nr:MAG: Uncharacterised protein [SAR116 cluster bacterium]
MDLQHCAKRGLFIAGHIRMPEFTIGDLGMFGGVNFKNFRMAGHGRGGWVCM